MAQSSPLVLTEPFAGGGSLVGGGLWLKAGAMRSDAAPLACPVHPAWRRRMPGLAMALSSVIHGGGLAVLIWAMASPSPVGHPSSFPAVSLTWVAPRAAAPSVPVPAEMSVQAETPAPGSFSETGTEGDAEGVPDIVPRVAPPLLRSDADGKAEAVPSVQAPKPSPRIIPEKKKTPVRAAAAPKARDVPSPAVRPVLPPPQPQPQTDLAASSSSQSVSRPALLTSSESAGPAAGPLSSPVTSGTSLPRGEEGVPVIREARYLEPPSPPEYPRRAVQLGLEGTVLVRALVEGGGVPRTVRIMTSSGVDSLDHAAVKAVSGWKFAVSDAGRLWVEIPVRFRLR